MKALARTLSLYFAAGAVGGLANSLAVWAGGRLGLHGALGVAIAPALTPAWLYPRLVWGGLWGALFLLPVAGSAWRRGLLLGLGPALFQLFVVFPYWQGRGWLGVELGALTPVVVIAANLVWGLAASGWLRGDEGMSGIPWSRIETLFLDAGNTLISIDFTWVSALLAERGLPVEPGTLARAEAAARPSLSDWLGGERSTESEETFRFYVRNVLSRLAPVSERGPGAAEDLADALVPVLRRRGEANRLWRAVLPGVPEALAAFRALGLQLVVVSNSDGSCERGLAAAGLRPYFDAVLDSALVGYEKPDPRFFEHALASAGTPRERVVHVGDLFHADVRGARAAGIHPVLLDPHGDWPEVDCERARDLGELAARLAAARSGGASR